MSNLLNTQAGRRDMVRGAAGAFYMGVSAVVASLLVSAGVAGAQQGQSAAGVGSAAVHARAEMSIGHLLHLRPLAAPRVVTQQADVIEYELAVEAASNAAWSLALMAPLHGAEGGAAIEVRDHLGQWREIGLADQPVVVLENQAASNPRAVLVQFRVRGVNADGSAAIPRFYMSAANGS